MPSPHSDRVRRILGRMLRKTKVNVTLTMLRFLERSFSITTLLRIKRESQDRPNLHSREKEVRANNLMSGCQLAKFVI